MVRTSILIGQIAIGCAVYAQPVIDLTGSPPLQGMSYGTYGSIGLPWPQPGPDQVWDLSQFAGSMEMTVLVEPTAMGGFLVPEATIMTLPALGDHDYYRSSGEGFDLVAEWRIYGGSYELFYTDPIRLLVYPCTYGTTWTDSYDNNYMNYPYESGGPFEWSADGYGTLVTSSATYAEVLKVHSHQVVETVIDGHTYRDETDIDRFWKQGVTWWLAEVKYTSYYKDGNLCNVSSSARILEGANVGIENTERNRSALYPNPAQGQVHLRSERHDVRSVTILDIAGCIVRRTTAGGPSPLIDIGGLAPGRYVVQIGDGVGRIESHALAVL
jgi:Secretion system C-terminal sorting domain